MWCACNALHQAVLIDEQLVGKYLDAHEWISADEGVTSELLLCRINGFHDVAFFLSNELVVDGDGRIEIHRQFGGDGDKIRTLCSSNKGVFVQTQIH